VSAPLLDAARPNTEVVEGIHDLQASALARLFGPDRLPRKPRCSNDPSAYGTRVLPLPLALGHRYIQYNRPGKVAYLVFDVDRPGAVFAWLDANLPPPNWTVENPANRHAHLVYVLVDPVVTSSKEHQGPARYVGAIETAFTNALRADAGFTAGITKNPLHSSWRTEVLRPTPYTLAELAEYVKLKGLTRRRLRIEGMRGRNCELFDAVRLWAYRQMLPFRLGGTFDAWHDHVRAEAHARNAFVDAASLPFREVDHIAKSIAGWTWKKYTGCGAVTDEFRTTQARRGCRKGASTRDEGLRLLSAGMSVEQVSQELDVTERTAYNWSRRLRGFPAPRGHMEELSASA